MFRVVIRGGEAFVEAHDCSSITLGAGRLSIEDVVAAAATFAESDLSGDEFRYRHADRLEQAAKLIREKVDAFKK